jgi:hypothetical protein
MLMQDGDLELIFSRSLACWGNQGILWSRGWLYLVRNGLVVSWC